jgi:hypothetical protein
MMFSFTATGINLKRRPLETRHTNSELLRKYGITLDDYYLMYAAQHGRCKICKRNQIELGKALHIDHDHATGKVRGLLCANCNNMLAQAHDKKARLKRAIKYLETNDEKGHKWLLLQRLKKEDTKDDKSPIGESEAL